MKRTLLSLALLPALSALSAHIPRIVVPAWTRGYSLPVPALSDHSHGAGSAMCPPQLTKRL